MLFSLEPGLGDELRTGVDCSPVSISSTYRYPLYRTNCVRCVFLHRPLCTPRQFTRPRWQAKLTCQQSPILLSPHCRPLPLLLRFRWSAKRTLPLPVTNQRRRRRRPPPAQATAVSAGAAALTTWATFRRRWCLDCCRRASPVRPFRWSLLHTRSALLRWPLRTRHPPSPSLTSWAHCNSPTFPYYLLPLTFNWSAPIPIWTMTRRSRQCLPICCSISCTGGETRNVSTDAVAARVWLPGCWLHASPLLTALCMHSIEPFLFSSFLCLIDIVAKLDKYPFITIDS